MGSISDVGKGSTLRGLGGCSRCCAAELGTSLGDEVEGMKGEVKMYS